MDEAGVRRPRSIDDTVRISHVPDHDQIGEYERAAAHAPSLGSDGLTATERAIRREPGWYDRLRSDVAARDAAGPDGPMWSAQDGPTVPRSGRHQAAKDDLPGPSRRELARLVRQVRALVIANLLTGLAGGVLIGWLIFR